MRFDGIANGGVNISFSSMTAAIDLVGKGGDLWWSAVVAVYITSLPGKPLGISVKAANSLQLLLLISLPLNPLFRHRHLTLFDSTAHFHGAQTPTTGSPWKSIENAVEVLQRYRRDRRVLLDFLLSGSLIKKVVMPPGAVSLDDVDLDQNNAGSVDEFFLATTPETSGAPPKRAPPPVPVLVPSPIMPSLSKSLSLNSTQVEEVSSLSKSQSLNSTQVQELTVDDIEDFEDDDLEEADSRRYSRRVLNDAADLVLGLPSFTTGITDDDLRETAYEILLAAAGASGGLIVPSKEKKKEKKSRLMRKLGRSKSEQVVTQSQHMTGLVGILETMRIQMELNMLEEGLVNHAAVGFSELGRKASELRILLAKLEESEITGELSG
ncbi:hypothetical protein RJ639_014100 [Escallonia herrerae]|uniref:Uncharacterized protein n=1 Tax=Escallonia herrerae TaxID=1293975 RepID=A0AA88VPZ4_9ASTE|nr:hypothetical protein RJ639_014100 [Escallonia herrerae]